MKAIHIQFTNNPDEIRNGGIGDYFIVNKDTVIIKAYLKDDTYYNYAWLIALHEMVEQHLTNMRGIKEEDIDTFDKSIQENGGKADEAGNEAGCPYFREHRFAENIERQLCYEMGLEWSDYYENYEI
jgi:hypothetical protein